MKKTYAISDIGKLVEGKENKALWESFQCLVNGDLGTAIRQNPTEAGGDDE